VRTLWRYRGLLGRMIFFLLFMGLSQSLLVLLSGPLLKVLLDDSQSFVLTEISGLRHLPEWTLQRSDMVFWMPVVLLAVGLLRVISSYMFQTTQATFSIRLAQDIRQSIFAHVMYLPYLKIKSKSAAEWMSTIINDVFVLQSQISQLIMAFLKDGILVFFAVIAIMILSPWLGLILLALAPFSLWGLGRYARRIRGYAQMWQDHLRFMAQNIFALRERFWFFKALRAEESEKKLFAEVNNEYYRSIRQSIFLRSVLSPFTEFVGLLLLLGVLYLVVEGVIKSEDVNVVQVFTAFALLIRPMKNIGEQLSQLGIVWGALSEVRRIFSSTPELGSQAKPSALPALINIKKCNFYYPIASQGFSLEVVDISFKQGEFVALVGDSGSGKSTFIKILAGLVIADEWQANIDPRSLALQSSYVDQEAFLFKGSIRTNLGYGHPTQPSEHDIMTIRDQLLMNMDLDKEFSSVHKNLSGGERQRIAIARALLLRRPLCLFDEALAAIDATHADAILRFCRTFIPEMTLIAITHRPEQLGHFDQIIHFENGRIL
jgi:ATP-binding cassette, subfamily B, bacterial MsbA